MYIIDPDMSVTRAGSKLTLEDAATKLTFEGPSADLCEAVLAVLPYCAGPEQVAARASMPSGPVGELLECLAADSLLLNLVDLPVSDHSALIERFRAAGIFWNKHIMAQSFPKRLFSGEATPAEVMGWGIEFYFFVRGANEYMARGASRARGTAAVLSTFWQHYVEEALHDDIFAHGLQDCGIDRAHLDRRPPLASTQALLNHLYEVSEEGALEYASLFTVMQPLSKAPEPGDITKKYADLRTYYPSAAPLFAAFEKHDLLDAGYEHSKLLLAPMLEMHDTLSRTTAYRLFQIVEETADFFIIFYQGISNYYRGARSVTYRQIPNAAAARLIH